MPADPIRDYVFTDHALDQLRGRGLDKGKIAGVLENPGQCLDVRPGRVVFQSKRRKVVPNI